MCVIATGLKKDFETDWFDACCKSNPDGFFVARVNKNRYIRTLDVKKAREFFLNSAPEDTIVLHARIKSVGPVNADNIHGWKAEGLHFCHNGTLSIKASGGRTDSETFFKDLFLPVYRYNGCKFDYVTDRVINACISTSKFLIIRRRKVHLYGSYTTKGGCKFSNTFWDHTYSPYFADTTTKSTTPRYTYHTKPSWFRTSAQPPANKLYQFLHARMILRDACSVAKILTKYVERGKLPSHTPLIALLDMYAMVNNHNDHRIYAPDSYPYKVWLWRSLLIRDQPQVDEFIELLSQFLEGKDTVFNASTFYNFLSTTAHKISSEYGNKVEGISDTSGKLSRLNKIRDQISDKAEWAKYTAGWTCEYVTAFVQAISPLLTFKALRAVVRMTTAMKTRKMNAYPAFTYLIREVCLDLARTLNLVAFDKLNDEAITYINNAVNRLSSIKHDAIGVAEDFWGYVGDLMNEPEEASAKYYTYEDDDYVLPLQAIAEDFVATIQRTYDYSCISTWGYDQYIDYADDINLGFLNPPGKPNDKPLTNNTVPLADANN